MLSLACSHYLCRFHTFVRTKHVFTSLEWRFSTWRKAMTSDLSLSLKASITSRTCCGDVWSSEFEIHILSLPRICSAQASEVCLSVLCIQLPQVLWSALSPCWCYLGIRLWFAPIHRTKSFWHQENGVSFESLSGFIFWLGPLWWTHIPKLPYLPDAERWICRGGLVLWCCSLPPHTVYTNTYY